MRSRRIFFIILALALVAAAIIFRARLFALGQEAWIATSALVERIRNPQPAADDALLASGMIEARTLDIASPTGGRVAALHVTEGQPVAAGDLIAELDTSLLDAQIAEAQAAVAAAQAQVVLLRAGARPVDLAVARAGVGQAQAAQEAARVAWEDALALVDAPSELDVQIAQATAALQVAAEQVKAAAAAAVAADLEQQLWGRIVHSLEQGYDIPLPIPGGGTTHVAAPPDRRAYAALQWNLASQHTWEAHAQHTAALAAQDAARQALADLQKQRAEPLALQAQAATAEAAQAVAKAAVETAQAGVAVLEAGASAEQIAAAEAAVAQAQAAVAALQTKKAQARLVAPEAGIVTAVIVRAGEVAAPAAAIVRLADQSEVTLTAYVPEPRLGEIRLGQSAYISVDAFPDQTFVGQVTHIAGRAEFTPKNVQTREERATTVFAVKITIPNPAAALKPGMPADATFGTPARAPEERTLLPTNDQPASRASSDASASAARYSGVIEATEVRVASEIGGRVARTYAAEGEAVVAGQVLAELDGEELAARRSQAEAALAAAEADRARVAAAPQPARIAQAEAGVKQAEAALAAAQAALTAAQTVRDRPQALDAQINAARAQVRTAAAAIDAAQAGLKAAQVLQESLPAPGSDEDRTRRAGYDQNVIAAEARVRAAQAQERGARATLAQLLAIRAQPAATEAEVHRAEGEVAAAQAALVTAQAVLAQTRAPAQPEAVAVAAARVAQAQAALETLDVMAARLALRSPITGTLTVQAIRAGEVAQPAAALFTVIDLRRVRLVIYVPTGEIGRVRLGQATDVIVDAYPERIFAGRVIRIADQAEFTPKNVQTAEERVKTVFAVEVELENADELLRPGMPADAVIRLIR